MAHDMSFLHTSPVHVATFEALMVELAPSLRAHHLVRDDLLVRAQHEGVAHAALVHDVQAALADAASGGARVVVCTCSTLGGIAEAADGQGGVRITRVDRAMADAAVRHGGRVLLVAALQSTLQPTTELLRSSAARLEVTVQIEPLMVTEAWPHFEAGRPQAYIDSIVAAVRQAPRGGTTVLAQASMAPAAAVLARQGISALTSPRLGVEHAVQLWRGLT
ncbi:MAG: Asp/Glu/hydantoin racemase [Rhizobacter sp.]|nr:Asp/Glu/hydantoin racemase [Rhizobacter sp.]